MRWIRFSHIAGTDIIKRKRSVYGENGAEAVTVWLAGAEGRTGLNGGGGTDADTVSSTMVGTRR